MNIALFAVLLGIPIMGCVALAWLLFRTRRQLARYSSIQDLETHQRQVKQDLETHQRQVEQDLEQKQRTAAQAIEDAEQKLSRQQQMVSDRLASEQKQLSEIQQQRVQEQQQLTELQSELRAVEVEMEAQSFGFYRPHYDFTDSDEFKMEIQRVYGEQKALVNDGFAAECPQNWTVDGSTVKGRKMVEEQMKLMLRAFNGECDAAIAKVHYNNVVKMQTRLTKSHEAINKLGKSKNIWVTQRYLDLKLQELRLTHEHHELRQREKVEQNRIKEQMREEQKVQKEIEKSQTEAEKEESRYQKALEQARADLARSTGTQHAKFEELVGKLENELSTAIDRKAKAIARAQLTRSGHIYIISNIGSFGKGVYKIGMSRRLEPHLRVKELGDASVPFSFDIHAMIYSEDAPALERTLHQEFDHRRVNRVNNRKEFFRVELDEIRQAVGKHHGIVTFVIAAEAEEFRKSVAIEQDSAIKHGVSAS